MIPTDYEERVYAGVLGKIIAVYLGRPFEGWRYEKITSELGEITYYVNDRTDVALKNHTLVVTDDDISGTFVFPRALRDHGLDPAPAQVARTWLDYLIENKAVLWWGGLGNSTEHTAYLRLRSGIQAPRSGSAATNGTVVSEQVGAQIFIEGFAMTCPGDPERAAALVENAASVSHDGEALQAARVIAALVAQAFTEPDMDRLLDTATSLIDKRSLISNVIDDVRGWVAADATWHDTRKRIEEHYGYDKYAGNCHVVPNHAVVISALARSGGEFSEAMTIVNTSGWDTDSNAGNVGAIAGIRGGLAGLVAGPQDWRTPVADRMYLPSADGGAVITDAARETLALAAYGRARYGEEPVRPKDGARFHFALPGSVQGFRASGAATVHNRDGALSIEHKGGTAAVTTPTFFPPDAETEPIYGMVASPTLYSGQRVRAAVHADGRVTCRLVIRHYNGEDELTTISSPPVDVAQGAELAWTVPDAGGQPIAEVGLAMEAAAPGSVRLEYLTWDGAADVTLTRPAEGGTMWRRAWVDAVDQFNPRWPEPFRIVQNHGTGLLITGSRDWQDYEVSADVTPHLVSAAGLAACVQGLHRYYAVEVTHDGDEPVIQLIRALGERTVLATKPFAWEFGQTYQLHIRASGTRVTAAADGTELSVVDDDHAAKPQTTSPGPDAPAAGRGRALGCGSVALLVTEGRTATQAVRVTPIERVST